MAKVKFYGVKVGRVPGVYDNWDACKAQVSGFSGAEYKSFSDKSDARAYVDGKEQTVTDQKGSGYKNFTSDKPYAFVDGSFNEKTGMYGYGGFLCVDGKTYELQGSDNNPEMASMRNVAGEIKGAIAAVQKAQELGLSSLLICYDYHGIEKWATGAWKTNTMATKAYANVINNARNSGLQIDFEHFKGHSGWAGNELADRLAKEAVGISVPKRMPKVIENGFFDNQNEDGYDFE